MQKIIRRFLAFACAFALVLASGGAAQASTGQAGNSGKWIEVILSQQRVNAWQGNTLVMTSSMSSGKPSTPTRRGTFQIYTKLLSTRMRGPGYDLPHVPYTMYFDGSIALHGAYWNPPYGRVSTHGCVNLPVPFAARLYRWAYVGMTVWVH